MDQTKMLEKLKDALEGMERQVSYAHEDILFVQHNDFLFTYPTEEEQAACEVAGEEPPFLLWFNTEVSDDELENLSSALATEVERVGLPVAMAGFYTMSEDEEGEELSIEFIPYEGEGDEGDEA